MNVPPMLIFKRKRFKNELKDGAPPLTIFGCSDSGWLTTDSFALWIRHFISYLCLKLLTENPEQKKILLILDGHSTHTKNLEALVLAQDHGIVMLS